MAAGELDSAQSALLLKCGACGMVGHMRTNRNCPLYEEPKKGSAATPAPRVVREPTSPAVVLTPAPPSVKVETTGTKLKLLRKPDASATPGGAGGGATVSAGGEGKVRIVVRKDLVQSLGGSSGGGSASKKRSRGGDEHSDGDEAFDAEDEFVERSRQQAGGGARRRAWAGQSDRRRADVDRRTPPRACDTKRDGQPRPVPCPRVVKNGSKILACASGEIPRPVSRTLIRSLRPLTIAPKRIPELCSFLPSQACNAFSSRFSRAPLKALRLR